MPGRDENNIRNRREEQLRNQRTMSNQLQRLVIEEPFLLESGAILPRLEIAFHTHGALAPDRDNVVWIYHALTGNSDPTAWWPDVVGGGKSIDPDEHFIVCANVLGSCYGSSGPLSIDPVGGRPWHSRFPEVTVRDSVRAFHLLRLHLGIERISLAIGASLGGQQALEAAIGEPELFERLVLIATNARHSPWGIAWSGTQRMAIEADPTWRDESPEAGATGLAAARAVAMLSYRSPQLFNESQPEADDDRLGDFRAESYQRYQGEKLARRFNAQSYRLLTMAMDSHNVGRRRGSVDRALARIEAETLVIGIASDLLFPIAEQRYLAARIPRARYREVDSPYGHDGFLIEGEHIGRLIREHLNVHINEELYA